MSGGHFNYQQYSIEEIANEIENIIKNSNDVEWYKFSSETIKEFKIAVDVLRKASVYVQRIDWLVSGDDGEDNFHTRLKEDLDKLHDSIY